jgi:hypothetical protein
MRFRSESPFSPPQKRKRTPRRAPPAQRNARTHLHDVCVPFRGAARDAERGGAADAQQARERAQRADCAPQRARVRGPHQRARLPRGAGQAGAGVQRALAGSQAVSPKGRIRHARGHAARLQLRLRLRRRLLCRLLRRTTAAASSGAERSGVIRHEARHPHLRERQRVRRAQRRARRRQARQHGRLRRRHGGGREGEGAVEGDAQAGGVRRDADRNGKVSERQSFVRKDHLQHGNGRRRRAAADGEDGHRQRGAHCTARGAREGPGGVSQPGWSERSQGFGVGFS